MASTVKEKSTVEVWKTVFEEVQIFLLFLTPQRRKFKNSFESGNGKNSLLFFLHHSNNLNFLLNFYTLGGPNHQFRAYKMKKIQNCIQIKILIFTFFLQQNATQTPPIYVPNTSQQTRQARLFLIQRWVDADGHTIGGYTVWTHSLRKIIQKIDYEEIFICRKIFKLFLNEIQTNPSRPRLRSPCSAPKRRRTNRRKNAMCRVRAALNQVGKL